MTNVDNNFTSIRVVAHTELSDIFSGRGQTRFVVIQLQHHRHKELNFATEVWKREGVGPMQVLERRFFEELYKAVHQHQENITLEVALIANRIK